MTIVKANYRGSRRFWLKKGPCGAQGEIRGRLTYFEFVDGQLVCPCWFLSMLIEVEFVGEHDVAFTSGMFSQGIGIPEAGSVYRTRTPC
jgi:hypothetical protein